MGVSLPYPYTSKKTHMLLEVYFQMAKNCVFLIVYFQSVVGVGKETPKL